MKIALGTAQFGLDYGQFGAGRKIDEIQVTRILDRAAHVGIDLLDTARAYGVSEAVLGSVRAHERFAIVTKCPRLPHGTDAAQALRDAFAASSAAVGCDRLYGYLLHDAADLDRPGVWEALVALRAEERVKRIGVSVYTVAEAVALCRRYPLTLLQLPANVLSPWFRRQVFPPEVEVHVRSVFLQGFLLADPEKLPVHFRKWEQTLRDFRARSAILHLSPLCAAIAPLLASPVVHRIIVGIDSLMQLNEILQAVTELADRQSIDLGEYPEVTEQLTDPRKWQIEAAR